MTRYLSPEQILFIHSRLIQETGGTQGIRDLGLLRSAAARPQTTFDQENLYPDLLTKAAALFQSLVQNHPFLDGNKRTGITATALFLQINGHTLRAPQKEIVTFTLSLAQGNETYTSITAWLKNHTKK